MSCYNPISSLPDHCRPTKSSNFQSRWQGVVKHVMNQTDRLGSCVAGNTQPDYNSNTRKMTAFWCSLAEGDRRWRCTASASGPFVPLTRWKNVTMGTSHSNNVVGKLHDLAYSVKWLKCKRSECKSTDLGDPSSAFVITRIQIRYFEF